jgi:hypothetical protein
MSSSHGPQVEPMRCTSLGSICFSMTHTYRIGSLSVIARPEGARATKIEGRQLEAGQERLTRRVPRVA